MALATRWSSATRASRGLDIIVSLMAVANRRQANRPTERLQHRHISKGAMRNTATELPRHAHGKSGKRPDTERGTRNWRHERQAATKRLCRVPVPKPQN